MKSHPEREEGGSAPGRDEFTRTAGPHLRERWILLILAAFSAAVGSVLFWRAELATDRLPRMCEGLPDYAALDSLIPPDAPILFFPGSGKTRERERFFCARFGLSPRYVAPVYWPQVARSLKNKAWEVHDDVALRVVAPGSSPR